MITTEQLKETEERKLALRRYLDIDSKVIQSKKKSCALMYPISGKTVSGAEAQMKKVKELHFWIDKYREVEKSVEELKLAFDFVKEEVITEEELDAIYHRTMSLIEELELRNMLRKEEDKLGAVLKINSGAGGVPRARIGPRCSCACICAGVRLTVTRRPSPIFWKATRPASSRLPYR